MDTAVDAPPAPQSAACSGALREWEQDPTDSLRTSRASRPGRMADRGREWDRGAALGPSVGPLAPPYYFSPYPVVLLALLGDGFWQDSGGPSGLPGVELGPATWKPRALEQIFHFIFRGWF